MLFNIKLSDVFYAFELVVLVYMLQKKAWYGSLHILIYSDAALGDTFEPLTSNTQEFCGCHNMMEHVGNWFAGKKGKNWICQDLS